MSGGKSGLTAAVRAVVTAVAVVLLGVVVVGAFHVSEGDGGPSRDSAVPAPTTADGPDGPASSDASDAVSSSPASGAAPPVAAVKSGAPPKDRAVAGRAVSSYLAKVPDVLSRRPKDTEALVARIGTPTFADELRANASYNRENGVRVNGTPAVTSLRVLRLDPDGQPPTAEVEACIDNSAVRIVDTRGRPVPQPRQARTRQLFSLVWSGGRWLIDSQGFPDDPSC